MPFLPNSACSLNNFLEPKASSAVLLLGKARWPWRGAGAVDASARKLLINLTLGRGIRLP